MMHSFSRLSLMAAVAMLLFSACAKKPEACFSANRLAVIPNKLVTFVNCSANSKAWNWDFGDGTSSTDPAPSHAFAQKGTYTVSLEVLSEKGDADTYSQEVFVGDPGPMLLVIDSLRFPATQASVLEVQMDGISSYSSTVVPFDLPVSINISPDQVWTGTSYDLHVKTTMDESTVSFNPQTGINSQMILRVSNAPFWAAHIVFTGR